MNLKNLQEAILGRNLDGVNQYIREKGDVNLRLPNGKTPLLYATSIICSLVGGAIDNIILRLVDEGADVNAIDGRTFRTATMLAMTSHRSEEIVLKLINAGTDVTLVDRCNKTALVLALMYEYGKEVIKTLINKGTDVNIPTTGDTVLFWAFRSRDPEIIEMVLKAGAIIYEINVLGEPIYTKYCRYRCEIDAICKFKRVTDFLINKGIDLKKKYRDGCTIIHLATCNYIIYLAQKKGISVDQANNFGITPLLQSLRKKSEDKVKDLLLIGADANRRNSDRGTVLHSDLNEIDKFGSLLIYHGANINTVNNFGESPLIGRFRALERHLVHCDQGLRQNIIILQVYLYRFRSIILNYLLYEDARALLDIIEGLRIYRAAKIEYSRYIDLCRSELIGMQNALLTDNLSIHQFCHEKRYYRSNYIPIKFDQYLINHDTISVNFPNYKDIIFMRLQDNSRKNFKHILQKMLIDNTVEVSFLAGDHEVIFDFKCWCFVVKYLNYRNLYALIAASFIY